jgi:hypothetical protein
MFGLNFLGPLGMATMGDGRPDNSSGDLSALTEALKVARAAKHRPMGTPPTPQTSFGPGSPNERVAQGFNAFGPTPLQTAQATPAPLPSPPALSAQVMAAPATSPAPAVPTPAPRPPEAPSQAPDMSWFQRNAAMMRDPSSGAFIDPTNAESAQASGPDVIQKLMSYFHNKDT